MDPILPKRPSISASRRHDTTDQQHTYPDMTESVNNRPLTLVYVWDADYPWDVRTEKTCAALTARGHRVHIVARNRKRSPAREERVEGTVHRIRSIGWLGGKLDDALGFPAFFNPRWRSLLRNTVRETAADIIIARDLPLCPTAIHIGSEFHIPVVFDMAENYPALMRALWETNRQRLPDYFVRNPAIVEVVERYSLSRVEHIVVVVEESRDRLIRMGIHPDRITIVSNTPPKDRVDLSGRYGKDDATRLDIVYMGNIEVVRGILESIDAMAELHAEGRNVRLRIIGKGRDEALARAHATSLGLGSDVVEFMGYIQSHADALQVVAASDIGLIPHRKCELWNTTIPNKLFDYMAAGVPVLSSDAIPCARIVRETGAGTVFVSSIPSEIAQGVRHLGESRAAAAAGAAGQAAIRGRYNWEHDTDVFERVLHHATRSE